MNVLPAAALLELQECGSQVVIVQLETPVYLERLGGDRLPCLRSCQVDIMLGTAAGPVHMRNVDCVVVDDEDDEFLLGNPALISLGINVNRQMELLAAGNADDLPDDGDDILDEDPEVGHDDDDEVNSLIDQIIHEADENGFSQSLMPSLRRVVADYRDLWRLRLGADEPARVEPFRLVLKKDSQPVRCKPRRYAPLASTYMRNYTKQLVACGYVCPNNASRWASAVVPVPKAGSDDFRITCDYRLLNRMTVPIAASVPNLAVVSSRVKGAKAIGKFDLFKGFSPRGQP